MTPWYRQFWPWFLISIPATSVVAGFATLFIAMHDPDGLVTDDYYEVGLAVNRDIDRDVRATDLGLSADLDLDPARGTVGIRLDSRKPVLTDRLYLSLVHPTRSGHDVQVVLPRSPQGTFVGHLRIPLRGNWHVLIEPADKTWRLEGRLLWPGQTHLALRADPRGPVRHALQ
jgi:uncharacterized protein